MDYYQLNSEKQEIRLLKLVGDKDSDHVSCELKHYRLDSLPQYKYAALSYYWGNPEDTTSITVDGFKVQVTKTLEAALYQLQVDGYHRVWADAICIDQTDDEEKSEQILHMRAIYSMARSVIVWLGPDSKSSRATMEYIEKINTGKSVVKDMLGTHVEDIGGKQRISRSSSVSTSTSRGTQYNQLDKTIDRGMDHLLQYLGDDSRAGLQEFFERPYWRRVWIIQEIVAAARITVYCGKDHTEMSDIERLLARTPEGKELLRSGRVPDFPTFQPGSRGESSHLLKLIMNSRASEFTNPRDKIFALRGLASDGEALIPVPDYNKPVEVVFEDFARTLLSQKKCGNILLFRPPDLPVADSRRLPSWAPDWSNLSAAYRPWHSFLAGRHFSPSYSSQEVGTSTGSKSERKAKTRTINLEPRFTFYDNLMKVRGYIIDEVDGVSAQYSTEREISAEEKVRRAFSNPRSRAPLLSFDETVQQEVIRLWLEANRDFVIGGESLRYWMRKARNVRDDKGLDRQKEKSTGDDFHNNGLKNDMFKNLGPAGLTIPLFENKDRPGLKSGSSNFFFKTTKDPVSMGFNRTIKVLECGMRLASTEEGRVVMVHPQARRGDLICCLPGCAMPVLLRRKETTKDEVYRVVGEAYVHPISDWGPEFLGLEGLERDEKVFFIE